MSPRIFVWLIINLVTAAALQAAIVPDFKMDSDPLLPVPDPVKNFDRDFQRAIAWRKACWSRPVRSTLA